MTERDVAPLGFGIVILLALAGLARAQDTSFETVRQQIPAPECLSMRGEGQGEAKACTRQDHQEWLADIQHWRGERRMRIGYDGSRYGLPALKWTQSSFFQPQLMVEDRYFYDPVTRRYTVDRYLDDLEKRYGGIDAVLIWETYPNRGCGIVAHFISRALFSST
jgi:gamma-glutamyl hercynylcysteine S-oxide synthase